MGGQKFVVFFRLQAGFSVGGISDHMGKDILIGIGAGLPSVSVDIGCCQDHAVLRDDIAPDDIGRAGILLCIVGIAPKLVRHKNIDIDKISDQQQEHGRENICENHKLGIVPSVRRKPLLRLIKLDLSDPDRSSAG